MLFITLTLKKLIPEVIGSLMMLWWNNCRRYLFFKEIRFFSGYSKAQLLHMVI